MLNSLIGATDLRRAVETIWNRDKSAFAVMDILIAVRSEGRKKVLDQLGRTMVLDRFFDSVDGVLDFLHGTGLATVFQKQQVKDLVDYVFGIETGLDSHSRKQRSGDAMENRVAYLFGLSHVEFRAEVYSREWLQITNALGKDEKRFDFVIETNSTIFLIEVNFYSAGGTKLNEVARSYSDIGPKINAVPGFEFVWVTDGIGWQSARNKLHEAFNILPRVYNLTSIGEFIAEVKQMQ